ncbi:MAG: hypothetical protein HYV25_01915 [Candidatus Harrisonbacteria bacterium]|nr:hypothetical protein [Candidatus Harrisonbacteria bacterium]
MEKKRISAPFLKNNTMQKIIAKKYHKWPQSFLAALLLSGVILQGGGLFLPRTAFAKEPVYDLMSPSELAPTHMTAGASSEWSAAAGYQTDAAALRAKIPCEGFKGYLDVVHRTNFNFATGDLVDNAPYRVLNNTRREVLMEMKDVLGAEEKVHVRIHEFNEPLDDPAIIDEVKRLAAKYNVKISDPPTWGNHVDVLLKKQKRWWIDLGAKARARLPGKPLTAKDLASCEACRSLKVSPKEWEKLGNQMERRLAAEEFGNAPLRELKQEIIQIRKNIDILRSQLSSGITAGAGENSLAQLRSRIGSLETSAAVEERALADAIATSVNEYNSWPIPYEEIKNELPEVHDLLKKSATGGCPSTAAKPPVCPTPTLPENLDDIFKLYQGIPLEGHFDDIEAFLDKTKPNYNPRNAQLLYDATDKGIKDELRRLSDKLASWERSEFGLPETGQNLNDARDSLLDKSVEFHKRFDQQIKDAAAECKPAPVKCVERGGTYEVDPKTGELRSAGTAKTFSPGKEFNKVVGVTPDGKPIVKRLRANSAGILEEVGTGGPKTCPPLTEAEQAARAARILAPSEATLTGIIKKLAPDLSPKANYAALGLNKASVIKGVRATFSRGNVIFTLITSSIELYILAENIDKLLDDVESWNTKLGNSVRNIRQARIKLANDKTSSQCVVKELNRQRDEIIAEIYHALILAQALDGANAKLVALYNSDTFKNRSIFNPLAWIEALEKTDWISRLRGWSRGFGSETSFTEAILNLYPELEGGACAEDERCTPLLNLPLCPTGGGAVRCNEFSRTTTCQNGYWHQGSANLPEYCRIQGREGDEYKPSDWSIAYWNNLPILPLLTSAEAQATGGRCEGSAGVPAGAGAAPAPVVANGKVPAPKAGLTRGGASVLKSNDAIVNLLRSLLRAG